MYVEHNIPKAHNANVAFVDCGILSNLLFPPPQKKKICEVVALDQYYKTIFAIIVLA